MSKAPVTRRCAASMIEEMKDASRSHSEWNKSDKKTLVSKCAQYGLPTDGSKRTLIDRLVDKFRKEDDDVLGLGGAAPMQDALPGGSGGNGEMDDYPTDAYDGDSSSRSDAGRPDGQGGYVSLPSDYSDFDRRSDSDDDLSPKRKKTKGPRSSPPRNPPPPPQPTSVAHGPLPSANGEDQELRMLRAEVRALRSQIKQNMTTSFAVPKRKVGGASGTPPVKRRRTTAGGRGNTATPPTRPAMAQPLMSTMVSSPAVSTTTHPSTPHSFQYQQRWGAQQQQQHQHLQPQQQQSTSSQMFTGYPAPPPPPPQPPVHNLGQYYQANGATGNTSNFNNPFLPPSIKLSLLRKIHRRDFVEFEELLPDNQVVNAGTRHESCISIDRASQTLKFDKDKIKKQKVDSLAKWLMAWTIYMQAYLHYHPDEFFHLYTYMRNFVTLASRYRFEACLNYDRNFRLSMANQQTLSADLRSVSWLHVSEEYRTLYLSDNPIPSCFHCKARGHLSGSCPDKKGDNSGSNTASSSFTASSSTRPSGFSTSFRRGRPQQPLPVMQSFQQNGTYQQHNVPRFHVQQPPQFRPPTPAQFKVCFRYNGGLPCSKPPCQFQHVCSLCFSDPQHPATQCTTQSSSAFRPGP